MGCKLLIHLMAFLFCYLINKIRIKRITFIFSIISIWPNFNWDIPGFYLFGLGGAGRLIAGADQPSSRLTKQYYFHFAVAEEPNGTNQSTKHLVTSVI